MATEQRRALAAAARHDGQRRESRDGVRQRPAAVPRPPARRRAMLGATAVFEDTVDGGKRRLAVVGLPFPDMDKAGAALLKRPTRPAGWCSWRPPRAPSPGCRRGTAGEAARTAASRSSGSGPPASPGSSARTRPRGSRRRGLCAGRRGVLGDGVARRGRRQGDRGQGKVGPAGGRGGRDSPPADRRALIEELQLPQPAPLDVHGRAISADRARERLVEWNRYLRSNRFKEQYMPRCPARGWPASVNAVVRFCPPNECDRCPRRPRDSVADVLASGHRAPCLVKAIERGGNESRYQAAAIIAVAAARRAKAVTVTRLGGCRMRTFLVMIRYGICYQITLPETGAFRKRCFLSKTLLQ